MALVGTSAAAMPFQTNMTELRQKDIANKMNLYGNMMGQAATLRANYDDEGAQMWVKSAGDAAGNAANFEDGVYSFTGAGTGRTNWDKPPAPSQSTRDKYALYRQQQAKQAKQVQQQAFDNRVAGSWFQQGTSPWYNNIMNKSSNPLGLPRPQVSPIVIPYK
jgi:hypothetical protein